VYGVAASKGTASNAGDIYLDGFVPTLDDENNITDTNYWKPSHMFLNMEQQPRRATVFIVPHRPVRTAGGVPPFTRGGVCGTAII
ncbi:hypothetical protein ONO39_25810, partial [Salmonella enterica subsp. enterica serovar Anatum]|nr:hypothetical protein [Salmonella enterica subsp. enterica serovar Anatum]